MATAPVKAGYWLADFGNLGDINPTLFTHLFCAFADVHPVSYEVVIPEAIQTEFANFSATVKGKNPSVKTLLSIGGNDPTVLASMASSPASRQAFIYSSIAMAHPGPEYLADGLWFYSRIKQLLPQMHNEYDVQVVTNYSSPDSELSRAAFNDWGA